MSSGQNRGDSPCLTHWTVTYLGSQPISGIGISGRPGVLCRHHLLCVFRHQGRLPTFWHYLEYRFDVTIKHDSFGNWDVSGGSWPLKFAISLLQVVFGFVVLMLWAIALVLFLLLTGQVKV